MHNTSLNNKYFLLKYVIVYQWELDNDTLLCKVMVTEKPYLAVWISNV